MQWKFTKLHFAPPAGMALFCLFKLLFNFQTGIAYTSSHLDSFLYLACFSLCLSLSSFRCLCCRICFGRYAKRKHFIFDYALSILMAVHCWAIWSGTAYNQHKWIFIFLQTFYTIYIHDKTNKLTANITYARYVWGNFTMVKSKISTNNSTKLSFSRVCCAIMQLHKFKDCLRFWNTLRFEASLDYLPVRSSQTGLMFHSRWEIFYRSYCETRTHTQHHW